MAVDPYCFKPFHFVTSRDAKKGGDQYSFPGLILKSCGYSLQLRTDPICGAEGRLPLNAPHVWNKWLEYEKTMDVAFDDITLEVPALARQLWADEYGEKEAMELPFYQAPSRTAYSWGVGDYLDYRFLAEYLRGRRGDLRNLKAPTGK